MRHGTGPAALCALGAAALLAAGCGSDAGGPRLSRLPPDVVPLGVGAGPAHRPPALSAATRRGRPVGRLRCTRERGRRVGAHVELIARGRIVLLPAGIGVPAPHRRRGAYVAAGRCSYPVRTREPTGVVEITRTPARSPPTLGALFDIWGQPLDSLRLATFAGRVSAWVNGRRWRRDPRAIPLARHAVIVLQLGSRIPPHAAYSFPPGL